MILQRPFAVITPTVDGDVLQSLAPVDAEFTPPELHRLVGSRSEAGIRLSLERLSSQGIVIRRRVGAAWTYRLNREHLAAAPITELAQLRERFLERLRGLISRWEVRSEYAALFGSAARGTMDLGSDLDIFVVRPRHVDASDVHWSVQRLELVTQVRSWTGNDVNVLEYGADDTAGALTSDDAVLNDIKRQGIRLFGPHDYLRSSAGQEVLRHRG